MGPAGQRERVLSGTKKNGGTSRRRRQPDNHCVILFVRSRGETRLGCNEGFFHLHYLSLWFAAPSPLRPGLPSLSA
jgi:hypothetical protein